METARVYFAGGLEIFLACITAALLILAMQLLLKKSAVRSYIKERGEKNVFFPLHPNNISYSRIILTVVALAFLFFGNFKVSAVLFVFAASSDFIDGLIAKKCGLITRLGEVLDPLADKFLTISLLAFFCYLGILSKEITYSLIFLDITGQFILRPVLKYQGKSEAANYWGKGKTALIMILLLMCFLKKNILIFPIEIISSLFLLCFFFSMMSVSSKLESVVVVE